MKTNDAYRLSRIQAEGWNAARASRVDLPGDPEEAAIEALCPYRSDPEKVRWMTGFRGSLNARDAGPRRDHGANATPRKTLHLRAV